MRSLLAALLLFCSTLALAQTLDGSAKPLLGVTASPEFLPVEEAYQLEVEVTGNQSIRLYWQITEAYYLYQHAFKFKLEAQGRPLTVTPDFPPALERSDEYFGDVSVYYDNADLTLNVGETIPAGARLAVTFQGCADAGLCYPPKTQYFSLDTDGGVTEIARPERQQPASSGQPEVASDLGSLPYMLLLAFLGGAILNLMPCVFPILSLKVLSFARSSDHDRQADR